MRKEPFVQPDPLSLADLGIESPPGRGVIGGASAAAVHGFPLISGSPARPCVILPRGAHARRHPTWEARVVDVDSTELLMTADGYPVTGLRRTAIDCARTLPLYDAVAILDWVLNRDLVSLTELQGAARDARGRGSGKLQRAVALSDRRAESAQESVGRVALRAVGVGCEPQYALRDGSYAHRFDLAVTSARTVIDLQSKAHHSLWTAVERDIEYLQLVNVTPGWRLALTVPAMVLPVPTRFVRAIVEILVLQSGEHCRALRKRYVDADGDLRWDALATKEAAFLTRTVVR